LLRDQLTTRLSKDAAQEVSRAVSYRLRITTDQRMTRHMGLDLTFLAFFRRDVVAKV